MERIGVRELRRDASRWLARVRAGETFVVTDRGDPIAQLGPLPERRGWAALVADGRIVTGRGRPLREVLKALETDVPEALDEASLSEALAALRAEER
ncbi:MAG: hypothetical protein WD080_08835 [Egibacteraceae bacterium]